jgi:methylenetetrahydrofolate reductase (NADPH)
MPTKADSKLAAQLANKGFVITAEYLPRAGTGPAALETVAKALGNSVTAVNVADNLYGVGLSSLAASIGLARLEVEPIFQVLTRDRNRLAIQSDVLGAAFLGIRNVLCLSGYHQALMGNPESAGVFDIDSIQLVSVVRKMSEEGTLANGQKIDGGLALLVGAVANPYLKPVELNMIRLLKKVNAGAGFIQTQAVFDVGGFGKWLEAASREGIADRTAILAGVMPLASAEEARRLADTYTDLYLPDAVIDRLKRAGDAAAQKGEGIRIAIETAKELKRLPGLRGIHILSGGIEEAVPEIVAAL